MDWAGSGAGSEAVTIWSCGGVERRWSGKDLAVDAELELELEPEER